ncbi:MAG: hypothetical protein WBG50_09630 [Desulfomonilaceae bacterium]
MTKKSLICLIASLFLIISLAPSASCGYIYAYAPMNAVTAEPNTPYNLDAIPECSRVYYVPCPTWGPFAEYLPDVPPVQQPFPGPFGICVPVP